MFFTFSFSTHGYHFVIEKIKTKTLSGQRPERETISALITCSRTSAK